MSGVLAGIRVVDFGRYVAAPYCATLLGYLGAEVIRVERPGGGEDRRIAPVHGDEIGAVFLQTGCNKKSVCLNLADPQSQQVRARLVASADVVVTNFPPSQLKRFELDLASLQKLKPDIILSNVSAYGEHGPLANRGGFDGIGQAMSGAMYMTGVPGAPAKAAAPYVDYSTAVLSAFGVMAALRERDQSGCGQMVSGSLLATALAVFNSHLIEQGVSQPNRIGTGNRVQTSAPSDVFETKDGHVLVHCPGDAVFKRWAILLERGHWITDSRFANDRLRGEHRDVVCAPMAHWCQVRTTDEALATLADAGIPAGPVLSPQQALDHPQTVATGVLQSVEVSGIDLPAPVAGLPVSLSHSETGIRAAPPAPGADTSSVLSELGFSQQEIDHLRSRKVIA